MRPSGKFTISTNSKLGEGVGSINRTPVVTCPGVSDWCKENCYGLKGLFKYWIDEYSSGMELPKVIPKLVRIHSIGDFDTERYIDWCIDLVEKTSDTKFWAYTRSWRIEELLPKLKELRGKDNMTLFASVDVSINEEPPSDWRVAWIENDERAKGVPCPHDQGHIDCCAECGICYDPKREHDVIFKVK